MSIAARSAAPALTYRTMHVARVRTLTPGMLRVTFTGDDLRELPAAPPDAYLKLFLPPAGQLRPTLPDAHTIDPADRMSWYRGYLAMPDEIRPPMRTYTVRAHRPESAELDVDFVRHGDGGPATHWAATAAPGDEVAFIGPHGLYHVPENTHWQLLAGDETALPAIAAILDELGERTTARAYIEVAGAAEEQPLAAPANARIHWVHRGAAEHGQRLLDALREADLPVGVPYAWLGGEAETVKFARRHLVRERGVDKSVITFTGYWRRGRSEDDAGRESLRANDAGTQRAADAHDS